MKTQLTLTAMFAILFSGLGLVTVEGGKAETSTINFQSDFEFETVSICGGEALRLGGTAHFVFHETISADGSSHQNTMMNYQKTGGVGLESGKKYQINEVNHSTVQDNKETDVVHSVITGTLVGPGKANKAVVTINLLTVFDEDGNAKTNVDKVETRCPPNSD